MHDGLATEAIMAYYAWCLIRTDSDDPTPRVLIPIGEPTDYSGTAKEYAEWQLAQQVGDMENSKEPPPRRLEVRAWEGDPVKDQPPDAVAEWELDQGIDDIVE
jgi:hypothetical protein